MSRDIATTHAIIYGRVQGVGYRAWTIDKAQILGLTGWVRNRSNGSVEAVFCGVSADVDAMVEACYSGPTLARVDSIKMTPAENKGWDEFHWKETV